MDNNTTTNQFLVKDCALSAIAMGGKAFNLKELHDKLLTIHPGCIYNHFWGGRLSPHFEVQEYHNDFAMWAYHSLHDQTLAERLAVIDPIYFEDLEDLRKEVLDVIEMRLDETDQKLYLMNTSPFLFVRSQIIIFDTPYVISKPEELLQIIPQLTLSSIFYHCIDAYRRPPLGMDDFSCWLESFGDSYKPLVQEIRDIDVYFMSLSDLQQALHVLISNYFTKIIENQVPHE